jgi:hypothetical protein
MRWSSFRLLGCASIDTPEKQLSIRHGLLWGRERLLRIRGFEIGLLEELGWIEMASFVPPCPANCYIDAELLDILLLLHYLTSAA